MLGQQREFVVRTDFPKPIGGGFGVVAEPRFALPQCSFGTLAHGQINVCDDNLYKLAAYGEHRTAVCFEVFDRSVGQYDSELDRTASLLAPCELVLFAGSVSVVRVNPSPHRFAARNSLQRIKPPDAVSLLRPIKNRRLIVDRGTGVAQLLCFGQISLALT